MAQRMQRGLTYSSNQHSKGGLTGITLNDKAVALLAHSLHSRSQLVRNLPSVQNELSKDPSSGRIQCTAVVEIRK